MMQHKFDRILEDCLDRMDRGEHLNQILQAYPGLEDKLESLVLVAMLGRALPPPVPSYTALRLGKNDLLAEMAMMDAENAFLEPVPQEPPRRPILERWGESLGRLQPAYRFAMLSVVLVMAGGFFTLSASASEITDRVIQSLFYGFEQVGEMFWFGPDSEYGLEDGSFFKGTPGFPDQQGEVGRGYPTSFENNEGNDPAVFPGGDEQGNINTVPAPFDFEDEDPDLDLEEEMVDDLDKEEEKDLKEEDKEEDKEDKEEEKDLAEEEKEEDKDLAEEEKEEEKNLKEEEKEEEKDLKEEDKEEDKEDKEEEKDLAEEEKEEEKNLKEEEKEEEKDLKEEEKEEEKDLKAAEKDADKILKDKDKLDKKDK